MTCENSLVKCRGTQKIRCRMDFVLKNYLTIFGEDVPLEFAMFNPVLLYQDKKRVYLKEDAGCFS